MLIRPYDVSDRDSVAAMDVETEVNSIAVLQFTEDRFTWRASPLGVPRRKHHDLAEYLDEDPRSWSDGLVAVLDDVVVGFAASALSPWNGRLILQHMYVDSRARGCGLGKALLHAVFASDQAQDAQHAWLETQLDNVPAIRAYERMGFRIVGLDQTLYGDLAQTDTAVFMSQPLAPHRTP
ncbi:MAG: GNAT family N-acetyltransferase [Jiangellaceae bacterium]